MKSGEIIKREITPSIDPTSVSDTAVCPCLFFRNLCPASVFIAVSSSGAEKYVDGMKSTKVWVMARDVMNIIVCVGFAVVAKDVVISAAVIRLV